MRKGGPSNRREEASRLRAKATTMSYDMHQKRKKNQILSRNFNEVLGDSDVSFPSNALLVGESITMLPNVCTRIKERNLLDGTRN